MNDVLKVAFVGAPQSGKSSLIEYLRNLLKDRYQVVIADEPPTILLKVGLDPASGVVSGLEFQAECLKEYVRVYERINGYLPRLCSLDKPVIVLMDTLPSIGCSYLTNDLDMQTWLGMYNEKKEFFSDYQPDIIFNCELLQGEFSIHGNAVRRDLDVDYVLTIEEKIDALYPDSVLLSNELSIEERAGQVVDTIEQLRKGENSWKTRILS